MGKLIALKAAMPPKRRGTSSKTGFIVKINTMLFKRTAGAKIAKQIRD